MQHVEQRGYRETMVVAVLLFGEGGLSTMATNMGILNEVTGA